MFHDLDIFCHREFLTEVLREGFNPNYGLFKLTHDGCLYPNSNVKLNLAFNT